MNSDFNQNAVPPCRSGKLLKANACILLAKSAVASSSVVSDLYEGNVLEVEQYNHGMTVDTNVVTLADIEPDAAPILLTNSLDIGDQVISVANTAPFVNFNGISI